jgi:hypothetical protein
MKVPRVVCHMARVSVYWPKIETVEANPTTFEFTTRTRGTAFLIVKENMLVFKTPQVTRGDVNFYNVVTRDRRIGSWRQYCNRYKHSRIHSAYLLRCEYKALSEKFLLLNALQYYIQQQFQT